MKYIKLVCGVSLVVFLYVGVIGVFMRFASFIGEQLGLGRFFINLLRKKKKT